MFGEEKETEPVSFLLPKEEQICPNEETLENFLAGDIRVNENPGLIALHTIFAREHNRLATKIKALARHKTDKYILNEARRYVIGQMQNIVYNEFLPSVLAESDMSKYSLPITDSSLYNDGIASVISLEFSTAAFRFGHTLVLSLIHI